MESSPDTRCCFYFNCDSCAIDFGVNRVSQKLVVNGDWLSIGSCFRGECEDHAPESSGRVVSAFSAEAEIGRIPDLRSFSVS